MNENERVQFILDKTRKYEEDADRSQDIYDVLTMEEYPAPLLASISKKLDVLIGLLSELVRNGNGRDTPVSDLPKPRMRPVEPPPVNIQPVSDILDKIV